MKNPVKNAVLGLLVSMAAGAILASNGGPGADRLALSPARLAQPSPPTDDTIPLPFPFEDHAGDPTDPPPSQALFLRPPSNLQSSVQYDPATGNYIFGDSLGGLPYRRPYTMTFEEYQRFALDRSVGDYWQERVRAQSLGRNDQQGFSLEGMEVGGEIFDRIFGSNTISIQPTGSAELDFALNINREANPQLPKRIQRNVTFEFDERIQMGVTGSVGDKMSMGINYNTEASFDFENQTKLGYEGQEDEIIQKIEAGNITMPLPGALITGSQSLYGFKTELRFGRLTVTSVMSQQKGESSTITVQGGAQVKDFELRADQYEANRHFFLAHYFRDNYEQSLEELPLIRSGTNITRVEVWVTNRQGNFDESRNIVALMDLGEGYDAAGQPNFQAPVSLVQPAPIAGLPARADGSDQNQTNALYQRLLALGADLRDVGNVNVALEQLGAPYGYAFTGGNDFEKVENARLLAPTEYTLNRNLGFISLNAALNADEVLAVAFEYTIGGQTYQVGEFSNGPVQAPNNLVVKMLKGTNLSPKLASWDLMMKNVYSLGAYQLSRDNFRLRVMYEDDRIGSAVDFVQGGLVEQPTLYLRLLGMDHIDIQSQPNPDGLFDFIEGVTINSQNGRLYLTKLEPFGEYLQRTIGDENITRQLAFTELYDSTLTQARLTEKNKFVIRGQYQSSSGSEIFLNALNIPQGSVKVTANGSQLQEGSQYIVDYTLGRVTILDQGLLESGTPLQISMESNSLFSIQTKTLLGTHLEYRISDDFSIGATVMNLNERPLTNKVNIGSEAISNTIWGFNGVYSTELPFLTRVADRWIPFVETKEPSRITFEGEFASMIPGTSRFLQQQGVSFIDDFENSRTFINVQNPIGWVLASAPQGQPDLFPEAQLNNNLAYGYNRALLAWYDVNQDLLNNQAPDHISLADKSNHLVRLVNENDIFPQRESQVGIPQTLPILNLAFYPQDRGPYNFDVDGSEGYSAGLTPEGRLAEPASRWGGIMRKMQTNDFEAANIEFIEFWLMDPFVYDPDGMGQEGKLYFNLGNISEDILKDSRKAFENGLPTGPDDPAPVVETAWGRVATTQALVNAFDNSQETRPFQDVGLDGLDSPAEAAFYQDYLGRVEAAFGTGAAAYQAALADPSADDFHFFRGSDYDAQQLSILERYKKFNHLEANSPTDAQNPEAYPTGSSQLPDIEDINLDNTLSENENYYQYSISLRPEDMVIGRNYITDIVVDRDERADGQVSEVRWYQFKIPIFSPERTVGGIQDFRSIRFMRMFMRGFEEPVVLRMAALQLVRGEWFRFRKDLAQGGEVLAGTEQPEDVTNFEILSVNVEENSSKAPVNYVLPPGVDRVIDPMNPQLRQLNEQAMVLRATCLEDGDARGATKNVQLDVRQYKRLKLDLHAEAFIDDQTNLRDGDVVAFVRVGTDFQLNYYEYEVPLRITPAGLYNTDSDADRAAVWPRENLVDIPFELFLGVKQERDDAMRAGGSQVKLTQIYTTYDEKGNAVRVMGSPNLSNVRVVMIGIRNPEGGDISCKSIEVWANELRLTDFNEEGGWAANTRLFGNMADFATFSVSASTVKPGFGSIEKNVNERALEETLLYDASARIELGKFFPQAYDIRVPMHLGLSETFVNPKFNPLNPDIPLEVALENERLTARERDSILGVSQDYTRRKSINFMNVRVNNPRGDRAPEAQAGPVGGMTPPGGMRQAPTVAAGANQPMPWSVANWSVSYSFNELYKRNINTEFDILREHYGAINYNYTYRPKNFTPFASIPLMRKPYMALLRDFNFYLLPNQVSFMTDMNKSYQQFQVRDVTNPNSIGVEPAYPKLFFWNRQYDLKHTLSRNLKFDFTATNNARVDEPAGQIVKGDQEYNAYVWDRVLEFGQNTNYTHQFNLTWTVPINKIRMLSWVNMSAKYSGNFRWEQGPMQLDDLTQEEIFPYGHILRNGNTRNLSTQFNMQTLYNKSSFLKQVSQRYGQAGGPQPLGKEEVSFTQQNVSLQRGIPKVVLHRLGTSDGIVVTATDAEGRPVAGTTEVKDDDKVWFTVASDMAGVTITVVGQKPVYPPFPQMFVGYAVNALMGLKNVSVTYNQTQGTGLPGYMNRTRVLGMLPGPELWAPGFDFVAGFQDPDFGLDAGARGWLTPDSLLNTPMLLSNTTTLDIRGTFEPIKGFKVDLNMNRTFAENSSQMYLFSGQGFTRANRMVGGNFSMTFNMWSTAFRGRGEDYSSEVFQEFLDNRQDVAWSLAEGRAAAGAAQGYDPNTPQYDANGEPIVGYPDGYGPLSQEVLLPAFLSAYAGKEVGYLGSSPFPRLPMLNWRVQYDGLSKFAALSEYVKSITLTHGYRSTYNVGNYTNMAAYDWDSREADGYSWVRETLGSLFLPEQSIMAVSIQEEFGPLAGVDVTLVGGLTPRIEYRRRRQLDMSFSNNQLSEMSSNDFVMGLAYRFSEFPIEVGRQSFKSDLNLKLDLRVEDTYTVLRKVEEATDQLSAGYRKFALQLAADYVLSERFSLRAFYDQTINNPKIQLTFPRSNTRVGFTVRFTLIP